MVPEERHERRELRPPITQLLIRIILETTRIRTDHRDLEKLKLEHTLDIHVHVLPLALVIAQLVTCPFSCTREG